MRRTRILGSMFLGVTVVAATVTVAAPTVAQATSKHPITKIAFADMDLFTVNADGSGLQQVTTTGDVSGPSFSPDGATIVYAHGGQLWLVRSGHAPTQLTHLAAGLRPAEAKWSPDGKWILYSHLVAGYRDVFKIRPTGGASTRMTWAASSQCYAGSPAWSPSSTTIAFLTTGSGLSTCTAGVFVQALGHKPVLAIPDLTARDASFTADGQHLVYLAQCDTPNTCGDNTVGFESTLTYTKVHHVSDSNNCHGDLCLERILGSPAGGWVALASYTASEDPGAFHESCWQGGRDGAGMPVAAAPNFCLDVYGFDFTVH